MKKILAALLLLLTPLLALAQYGIFINAKGSVTGIKGSSVVIKGGHFINNGAFTGIRNSVQLTGAATSDTIGGNGNTQFDTLEINKPNQHITLTGYIAVAADFILLDGYFNLHNSLVSLGDDFGQVVGETEDHYITGDSLGLITKMAIVVPRPAVQFNPGNLGARFTTSHSPATIHISRGHQPQTNQLGKMSVRRNYDISSVFPDSIPASMDTLKLELHYWDHELNGSAKSALSLWNYTNSGNVWDFYTPDTRDDVGDWLGKYGLNPRFLWTLGAACIAQNTTQAKNICAGDTLFVGTYAHTQTGAFIDTLKAKNGCDSIIKTNLSVYPKDQVRNPKTICEGDSVAVGNHIYRTAGQFVDTLKNIRGCDSVITTIIAINKKDTTLLSKTSCNPQDTGVVRAILKNRNGCDSLIITTTTLSPKSNYSFSKTICQGDSAQLLNKYYTVTGIYKDSVRGFNGCDSVVTMNLTVYSRDTVDDPETICQGDSVVVGNHVYRTAGQYIDTLKNIHGCDSLVTTIITVYKSDTTLLAKTTCNPADTGISKTLLNNQYGCDSLIITTTTLSRQNSSSFSKTICQGDSAFLLNKYYRAPGIYKDSVRGSNGCDSIVTMNLTVNKKDTILLSKTSCNPQDSGVARTILKNLNGCDSLIITTTTLSPKSNYSFSKTICQGDSAQLLNKYYTATGIYKDSIRSENGCDSVVTMNLTVNKKDTTLLTKTSCNPLDIGIARTTLKNRNGCDSLIITTTSLSPKSTYSFSKTICQGDSAQLLNKYYTTTGIYKDSVRSSNGCDSVVTMNLTVYSRDTVDDPETICQGDSVVVGNHVYRAAGQYIDTLKNIRGCDSIVTTIVTLYKSDTTLLAKTSCNPADTGISIMLLNNQYGCDSLIITTTNLSRQNSSSFSKTICQGDSALLLNKYYTATGIYKDSIRSENGCDSIVTMNLTVNKKDTTLLSKTSCNPQDTGVIRTILKNRNGCDSLNIITTTLSRQSTFVNSKTICQGDSVRVGAHIYKLTGTYLDTIMREGNCDSIVQTMLTVRPAIIITRQPISFTECASGALQLSVEASGGLFQWRQTKDTTGVWTNVANATTSIFTPPATLPGVTFYQAVVSTPDGVCPKVFSAVAKVVISRGITIIKQPDPVIQCIGANRSLQISAPGANFQWQQSSDGATGWTNASAGTGATDSVYTPPSSTAGVLFFRARAGSINSDCGGGDTSRAVRFEVIAGIKIDTQPVLLLEECVGEGNTLSVKATGGTFQWQQNTVGGSNWVDATDGGGATTPNYTPPSATPGVLFYRVIVGSPNNACGASLASDSSKVNVIEKPAISRQPADLSECAGENATLSASATGSIFQWQQSPDSISWTTATGAGAQTLAFIPLNDSVSVKYYRLAVGPAGSFCGQLFSKAARVQVVGAKNTRSIDTTLCAGSSLTVGDTLFNERKSSGTVHIKSRTGGCDTIVNVKLAFKTKVVPRDTSFVLKEGTTELDLDLTPAEEATGGKDWSISIFKQPIGGTLEQSSVAKYKFILDATQTCDSVRFAYLFCGGLCGGCDTVKVAISANVMSDRVTTALDPTHKTLCFPVIEKCPEYAKGSEFRVFNRWGETVYRQAPYDFANCWGGVTSGGKELPAGTYYFNLTSKTSPMTIRGSVTIIRDK